MTVFGKLGKYSKHKLEIETDDELDISKISKYANGRQVSVSFDIEDGRRISPDQRKKLYALFDDYANWTGYSPDEADILLNYSFITKDEAKQILKRAFILKCGYSYFSLSDCSMTYAQEFITWILDLFFDNDIPFKTKTWDMIPVDYHLTLKCLRYKKCVICGKTAQFAHVDGVGIGMDRTKVDHRKKFVLPLCYEHHHEQHTTHGAWQFARKYHLKPVKPDLETLRILKVRGDYEDEEELDGTTKDVQ